MKKMKGSDPMAEFRDRDKRFIDMPDLYQSLSGNQPIEKINAACYLVLHTVYLNNVNYKQEIRDAWRAKLGTPLPEDAFRYIRTVFRVFTDRVIINAFKHDEIIRHNTNLRFLMISLELDLYLIDCAESQKTFTREQFRQAMEQKYFGAFNRTVEKIEQVSIPFIEDFKALGQSLRPYKNPIKNIFERLLKTNEQAISHEVERAKAESESDLMSKPENEQTLEKIRRLETDIAEFQRRYDEQVEYAQTQYERGIRDVFKLLNDEQYSRIIDYFYALTRDEKTEPNLRGYLENFFIALEEADITPIFGDDKIPNVPLEQLIQTCNLNFDKKDFESSAIAIQSPGWRFRNVVLDKPTLVLKK